jgi:putative addiction module component (TIGR02574 family)
MIWALDALNICGKSRGEEMEQLSVLSDLKKFSVAEKIIIVEELWNSIAADQESFGLTGEQRDELDRRVADYYASPDDGCSWEDVKSRIKRLK